MHRSGTSAMANIMAHLGGDIGKDIMPPASDNPAGFYENNKIVSLNDEILLHSNRTWMSIEAAAGSCKTEFAELYYQRISKLLKTEYSNKDSILIKDPRLSLTLPVWRKQLDNINVDQSVIIMIRHPMEVMESLRRRNNIPQHLSALLWLHYTIEAERNSRGLKRCFVRYSSLIDDPASTMKYIASSLGINIEGKELSKNSYFLDKSNRHHVHEDRKTGNRLLDIALDYYFNLIDCIERDDLTSIDSLSEELNQFLSDLIEDGRPLFADLYELIGHMQNIEDEKRWSLFKQDERIEELEKTLEDKDKTLAEYETVTKSLDNITNQVNTQLSLQQSSLNQLTQRLDDVTKILSRLDGQFDGVVSGLSERNERIANLEVQINNAKGYFLFLEQEVSKKNGHIAHLEKIVQNPVRFRIIKRALKGLAAPAAVLVEYSARLLKSIVHVLPISKSQKRIIKNYLVFKLGPLLAWSPLIRSVLNHYKAANVPPAPRDTTSSGQPQDISAYIHNLTHEIEFSVDKSEFDLSCKERLNAFVQSTSTMVFPAVRKPEISVVLILYNRAELTLTCLQSLLLDNLDNIEIVVVDNNSTDKTSDILKTVQNITYVRNTENLGFVKAVNQGAQIAQGEYLLLLNNDTIVVPGAMRRLLNVLKFNENAGAVGGRIINLNGKLQEAGNYIFSDGGCNGYGRGSSPYDPEYMFMREVDYCSGAFLMTSAKLFSDMGGFDEEYSPAYYEETDYCVRLRKSGKSVIYVPDAPILHYEFASSGSMDKALELQIRNREKFFRKHSDFLSSKPEGVTHNRYVSRFARHDKPSVIYLDDRVPHKYFGSGFPRSNSILSAMADLGCLVTLCPIRFPFEEQSWDAVYSDIDRRIEVLRGCGVEDLKNVLIERKGSYDILFVSRPHNMELVNELYEAGVIDQQAKLIYDAEALFSLRDISFKELQGKSLSLNRKKQMVNNELAIAKYADRIVTVSPPESKVYQDHGFRDVHILAHKAVVRATPESLKNRKDILFVGGIHACESPNADSLIWFIENIFPKIRKFFPDVKLNIAGICDCEKLYEQKNSDIIFHGRVDDLWSLYSTARVFIAPTRYAAGIPMKVHHAASYGLPVVTTTLILDQLGWINRQDILASKIDNPEGFAEMCIEIYQNDLLWKKIRENALARIRNECSEDRFTDSVKQVVENRFK